MKRIVLGCLVALGAMNCEGTSTGNPASTPLQSFSGSDCQVGQKPPAPKPAPDAGSAVGKSAAPLDENQDDFYRLNCIAWELGDDDVLRLKRWNMSAGCSAKWVGGNARFEGNELHLEAYEQGCLVSACGSCIYDLEWEVKDAPRDDVPVYVDVTDEHETSCDPSYFPQKIIYTLPLATEPSGTRCSAIVREGFERPMSCSRHTACGDSVRQNDPIWPQPPCPVCPNGDVCGPIEGSTLTECLAPCTADADCTNPSMACRNGACTIVKTW